MAFMNRSASNQENDVQEKDVQKTSRRKRKRSKKDASKEADYSEMPKIDREPNTKSVKASRGRANNKKHEKIPPSANPFSLAYKYARVKSSSSVAQTQDVHQFKVPEVVATKKKENKAEKSKRGAASKKDSNESKKKTSKKAEVKSELLSLSNEFGFSDMPKLERGERKKKSKKTSRTHKGRKEKKGEGSTQLSNPFQLTCNIAREQPSHVVTPSYEISKFSIEMKTTERKGNEPNVPEVVEPNATKKDKNKSKVGTTIIMKGSSQGTPQKLKVESLMNYLEKSQQRMKCETQTSKAKKSVAFTASN